MFRREVNHRLSWWSCPVIFAALIALPWLPTVASAQKGAQKGKPGRELRAVVQSVDPAKGTITVRMKKSGSSTFALAEGRTIQLDTGAGLKRGILTDLVEGLSVTLRLAKDNTVVSVRAEGPTVRGTLKAVDAAKRTVTVALSKKGAPSKEKTFRVGRNAGISIEDGKRYDKSKPHQSPSLAELPLDTPVVLKLSVDGKVVGNIHAEGGSVSGRVNAIDAAKRSISITISRKGEADVDRTFTVPRSASVTIDGDGPKDKTKPVKRRPLGDVPKGARVTLRLAVDGNSVLSVHAHGASLNGRVKAVDPAKGTITLQTKTKGKTVEKSERTLPIGKRVAVVVDDKPKGAKLGDVPVGAFVFVRLDVDGKQVREIRAIGPTVMGRLVRDAVNFTVSLGGKQGEKDYNVTEKTRIVIAGRKAGKLADLIAGTMARLRLSVDRSTVLEVHAEGPRYQGLVKAVEPEKMTITLTIGGKNGVGGDDKQFKLAKATAVIRQSDKTRLKVEDIRKGDTVTLQLSIDQKAASSIVVRGN